MQKNIVILMTGTTTGLGFRWLELFLSKDYTVIALNRKALRLAPIKKKYPNHFLNYECDLSKPSSISACLKKIQSSKVIPDIIINNAGFGLMGPMEFISPKEVENQFQVNVFSVLQITNFFIPLMRKKGAGKIINVGSSAGTISSPLNGVYAATKHAIEAITDGWRFELINKGIQTTCIQFGLINTPYIDKTNILLQRFLQFKNNPYVSLIEGHISHINPGMGSSPSKYDQQILQLLESKKLARRYVFDLYSWIIMTVKNVFPSATYDYLIRRKLPK